MRQQGKEGEAMAGTRLLMPNFLPAQVCKELEFIHKSCGVVGYRPQVLSTTLSHLVATNGAALLIPFIAVREKVKEAVEEYFACEFELFVEFTGLISWTRGAKIGWHTDNNRPYLQQRHFSAVCYLNTCEQDFQGGLFHFQKGKPSTVVPTIGSVVIYSADEENVHCVDEVTKGERCTLALWFTRDSSHDEDRKLIQQLSGAMSQPAPCLTLDDWAETRHLQVVEMGDVSLGAETLSKQCTSQLKGKADSPLREISDLTQASVEAVSRIPTGDPVLGFPPLSHRWLPVAASSSMYWISGKDYDSKSDTGSNQQSPADVSDEGIFVEHRSGSDIRVVRLAVLGFHYPCPSTDSDIYRQRSSKGFDFDISNLFDKSLQLEWNSQRFPFVFANALHVLQVAQFREWRRGEKALCCELEQTHVQSKVKQQADACVPHMSKKRCIPAARLLPSSWNDMTPKRVGLGDSSSSQSEADLNTAGLTTISLTGSQLLSRDCSHEVEYRYPLFVCQCSHKESTNSVLNMVKEWELYVSNLWESLSESFPHWQASGSLFTISS